MKKLKILLIKKLKGTIYKLEYSNCLKKCNLEDLKEPSYSVTLLRFEEEFAEIKKVSKFIKEMEIKKLNNISISEYEKECLK